jgi:hypothetical protein
VRCESNGTAVTGLLDGRRLLVVGVLMEASSGTADATLESTARRLAREPWSDGVRVDLVSCGAQRTLRPRALPGRADLARK